MIINNLPESVFAHTHRGNVVLSTVSVLPSDFEYVRLDLVAAQIKQAKLELELQIFDFECEARERG